MKDTLPSANEAPLDYYEMNLEEARLFLEPRMGELVSFKLRPIAEWSSDSNTGFENRYVYPEEYERIYKLLETYKANGNGEVAQGQATAYVGAAGDFLFVQHETGPEIVLYIGDGAGMALAKSVVDLITAIIKTISKSNDKRKTGKKVGRLQEAHSIVIEERTKKGARILKIVPLPLKRGALDPAALLKRVFENV